MNSSHKNKKRILEIKTNGNLTHEAHATQQQTPVCVTQLSVLQKQMSRKKTGKGLQSWHSVKNSDVSIIRSEFGSRMELYTTDHN